MDLGFGPFKRGCGFLVTMDKAVDGLAQLPGVGATEMTQGLTAENAEPHLHQVEPGGVGGNEMQVDVGGAGQTSAGLRLVSVEVVHDDVQLTSGMGRHDIVHEIEKLAPTAALVMPPPAHRHWPPLRRRTGWWGR